MKTLLFPCSSCTTQKSGTGNQSGFLVGMDFCDDNSLLLPEHLTFIVPTGTWEQGLALAVRKRLVPRDPSSAGCCGVPSQALHLQSVLRAVTALVLSQERAFLGRACCLGEAGHPGVQALLSMLRLPKSVLGVHVRLDPHCWPLIFPQVRDCWQLLCQAVNPRQGTAAHGTGCSGTAPRSGSASGQWQQPPYDYEFLLRQCTPFQMCHRCPGCPHTPR